MYHFSFLNAAVWRREYGSYAAVAYGEKVIIDF